MATNPSTLPENSGRITAANANYPYGSAKDDTTGTTGDGTPIKKALLNDTYGFYQWLLDQAGIVPSGNAETVLACQLGQALDQLFNRGSAEFPLDAMEFPEIFTANNMITVTPAGATAGGTVSVAPGTSVYLGVETEAGVKGYSRAFDTVAFTSADLDASSTYYLRGRVTSGAMEIYVQKGTDSDGTPASYKGTPGAGSGGGFDSTGLDVLFAKVETGTAGTTPTVTELANRRSFMETVEQDTPYVAGTGLWVNLSNVVINWGRAPRLASASLGGFKNIGGGDWEDPQNADTIRKAAVEDGVAADRYRVQGRIVWEDDPNANGQMKIKWVILG